MKAPAAAMFLEVDDIEKRFNETKAVDHVSFGLHNGEFLTLLGPSGCGKTTTLRAIAGFETINSGRIVIDGRTVSDPAQGFTSRRKTAASAWCSSPMRCGRT